MSQFIIASTFQSIANICYEMFDFYDDFEIVLVLKMNTKYNYESLFSNFLSAFPPSCLVVPFDDPNRRDYICCYLDVRLPCECFIVDRSSIALLRVYPDFAVDQGADSFPSCHRNELEFMSKTQFQKFLNEEELCFSKLNENKVVGLYLWAEGNCCIIEGSFIHTLNEVYEQCRGTQQEFEIVVVYIPFGHCLPPEVYQGKVDKFMKENKISWWRMPFNNSICRNIWRICGYVPDSLLIVGPCNEYVDLYGREILKEFGSDGYPFTIEGLISNHVKLLKELTLESLLTSELYDYVLKGANTRMITVASLQPRNILLYFGSKDNLLIIQHLQKLYRENPNIQVVYVQRNKEDNKAIDPALSDIPWLVRPFQTNHSKYLGKRLFPPRVTPFDTLVEFGIDGHVSSVDTQNLFKAESRDGIPFECNLRRDVVTRLESCLMHMEDMV